MTSVDLRRVVEWASAILIAGALVACMSSVVPSPTTPTTAPSSRSTAPAAPGPLRLLVLLGTPGHMRLSWLDGIHETPVPLPTDDVRWASGSAARGLVLTAGPAGRVLVTGPFDPGDRPPWHEVPVDATGRQWLGQPLADAVADATSGSIAVVAADPASGFADGHLIVLDPASGLVHAIALPGRWDGRAPAWFAPGRVAVSTRDAGDAIGLTIVDPASGATERWGTRVAAFTASGDGLTLAWQDRDDRAIAAGRLGRALAGAALDSVPIGRSPGLAAQVLLDTTGRRLGIAWLDDAGDTTAYAIYRYGPRGWALEREGALPRGTSRAVLVSLGP